MSFFDECFFNYRCIFSDLWNVICWVERIISFLNCLFHNELCRNKFKLQKTYFLSPRFFSVVFTAQLFIALRVILLCCFCALLFGGLKSSTAKLIHFFFAIPLESSKQFQFWHKHRLNRFLLLFFVLKSTFPSITVIDH